MYDSAIGQQDTTTVVNPTKPVTKKDVAKVGTKFVVAGQAYKVTFIAANGFKISPRLKRSIERISKQ